MRIFVGKFHSFFFWGGGDYQPFQLKNLAKVEEILLTVLVYFSFKVSQYRKYTQTNIKIQFINNKMTNAYTLAILAPYDDIDFLSSCTII